MNWYQLAHNPEAIESVFKVAPALEKVRLLNLDLSTQTNEATLNIELLEFPDKPSARWAVKGFTVAQIKVVFFGVKSLAVSGWGNEQEIAIQIYQNHDRQLHFVGKGPQCEIRFAFAAFRIVAIDGYSYATKGSTGP